MKRFMKQSVAVSAVSLVVILLLIGTGLAVVINTVYRFKLTDASAARYELTYYANQFMNASSNLTKEVRAYAATGQQEHYDDYWNEVNVLKHRENGVAMLHQIGVTPQEDALISEMASLSDELVPLEAQAMEFVKAGDMSAALDIVYGAYYNDKVAQINSLQNQFLQLISERSRAEGDEMIRAYNLVNLIIWLMVAAIIPLQIFQNKELRRRAYIDPLTGNNNYTSFREKMRKGMGVSGEGYVVSVDLQGFTSINDTCGIAKGDEIIREMSNILVNNLEHGELSAHVSGDCFVLFLHSDSEESLIERITFLQSAIVDLSALLDVPHVVPVFGIRKVDSPEHPERGYSDANLAKQQIKKRSEHFYAIFNEELRRQVLENQKLEDNFKTALQEHQFEMWYQPKYCPITGKPVAAEALVRWRSPDEGMISPGKFIPLFERNGMIVQLDEYVFESVCTQMRTWIDEGREVVPVSVNVSRASLLYPDIVARYMVIASRCEVPINYIELEITESAMEGTRNIEEQIQLFRSCGFRILMDDFGSGYSSLFTLTKKYFDNIKIDKSLVDCINTPEGDSLVESIIRLVHKFHMSVTAEGVEEVRQVEFLAALECDNIQGYYYSRPLPVSDFCGILGTAAEA